MRFAVRLIDNLLCLGSGLFEFSHAPDCIMLLQYRSAPHDVTLRDQTIHKGEPVLGIHLWNQRMPVLPDSGPDLGWALNLRRRITFSFEEIARFIQDESRCKDVRGVCGISSLFSFSEHIGGLQMMQRLGFTVLPFHRPFGRFGEFWENLFSWALMWTYNSRSLQSRHFWHLQRSEIWMTRKDFLYRFSALDHPDLHEPQGRIPATQRHG